MYIYQVFRVLAYRQFTRFVHGYIKDKRIPLPACDDDFKGYEDLEEN